MCYIGRFITVYVLQMNRLHIFDDLSDDNNFSSVIYNNNLFLKEKTIVSKKKTKIIISCFLMVQLVYFYFSSFIGFSNYSLGTIVSTILYLLQCFLFNLSFNKTMFFNNYNYTNLMLMRWHRYFLIITYFLNNLLTS